MAFWMMSRFEIKIWRDVHRGIGDEQGLRMAGDVHDEDVADAPSGP